MISRSSSPTDNAASGMQTSPSSEVKPFSRDNDARSSMALLRLERLGDLQMQAETGSVGGHSPKQSQALLAYLGVKPSQRVSREKIATLLWSSTGPDQARQSLRQTLSTLRKE